MDGFNSREFYGYSLSEDPKLRTTTRNYEFKYNSSEHLERIISRVKTDREKKKQTELLASIKRPVQFRNRSPTVKPLLVTKLPTVETHIGRSCSRDTVVKIMSDHEIEEMISQVLQSTSNLASLTETKPSDAVSLASDQEFNEMEPRRELQTKLSEEILPTPQPQWVEIKPAQKSMASIFEIPVEHNLEESSDYEDLSDVNLASEKISNDTHFFDSLSFGSRMAEDFLIRNQESSHENEDESPPDSPMSLGIESSLNRWEKSEFERVFGNIPHVPTMDFENLNSQEEMSEYSESSEKQEEIENINFQDSDSARTAKEEFNVQLQNIQQIDPVSQPVQSLSFRSAQSSIPKTPRTVEKPSKPEMPTTPLPSSRKLIKPAVKKKLNLQIEDLKEEKIRIFSKMTSIQEKIIKSLDALRISLVNISLPDGELENKLRERNVLEFSVRFSRNYLFPLGKMIEELRLSPKEDYRSALTNEPCVRICGIYGLLNQAVQCYQKQLRHFLNESVPKKLDLLLNLIRDTTKLCLEKQIFDKHDILVQALISRCETFIEFLENKKSARAEEIVLKSERKSQLKLSKTSSKWDLTMSLNKLNMYEPKLVQKKPKKTLPKKPSETVRSRTTPKPKKPKLITKRSDDHLKLPIDDPVETQVGKDSKVDSVQMINDAIATQPDSDLTKTVIETLQDITKDEVLQMFGPIVSNMDSILKSSDNPQAAVESVLDVLKSKLQKLKIDENSNLYQKEVTPQFKEKTQNTQSDSKNVKEGSTEQTERYNSRNELPGTGTSTICDNGAFLSAPAATAKKHTPIEFGGMAAAAAVAAPSKVGVSAASSSPVRNGAKKQMETLKYRSNAHYTFVRYSEDNLPSQDPTSRNLDNPVPNKEALKIIRPEHGDGLAEPKPIKEDNLKSLEPNVAYPLTNVNQNKEELQTENDIKALLDEREAFIKRCKDDPLYSNAQYPQPWKVLSKISHGIAREIVESFENNLSFGEESYVRDFINMEMQT